MKVLVVVLTAQLHFPHLIERGDHMGISIKDIVALATAGYKPSEVKELIALSNQSEEPDKDSGKDDQPEKDQEQEEEKEHSTKAGQNGTDEPEEDSAILSYKKKVEELEEQIKKLQSDNVHKDQSDNNEESDEQKLDDITRLFM